MVGRDKKSLLVNGMMVPVLGSALFITYQLKLIGNRFPCWLFYLIVFCLRSFRMPFSYYFFSTCCSSVNSVVTDMNTDYVSEKHKNQLNPYTMKNVNIKSSFVRSKSQTVSVATVDKYLGHHLVITKCLGRLPNYLYTLSSFQLRLLKLQLETNRPFLSSSVSTQNSYLVSLNALINFVRTLELSTKKDAKVISLPKDQSGADSKKAA